jgi:predicted metal-binding membrane protein
MPLNKICSIAKMLISLGLRSDVFFGEGQVMNLAWIAGIAVLVLVEKVVPAGRALGRIAGIGFVASGVWVLLAR